MKEDFLHYLWKYKKFDLANLKTSNGEPITIVNGGQYLQLAGPDFFNAQLIIGNQKWAGNVEIHLRSSDWYIHHHELDQAYENVILHVVWENDTAIFRKNNTEIPALVLKDYVSNEIVENYRSLVSPKSWIFCEKQLMTIDIFRLKHWQERLFFERLERKSAPIEELLEKTSGDWEAVLFCLLAKNFGLNTNGGIFMKMACSLPFAVIRKESFDVGNLEALFFGTVGMLTAEKEDTYFREMQLSYHYLFYKYQLKHSCFEPVQFFKHRPDNFPTIRLSQLAALYNRHHNLFSEIMTAVSAKAIYDVFKVAVSDYWQTHYQFDKESPRKKKQLAKTFIDLVIINTIVPIRFAYSRSLGKEIMEELIDLLNEVAPENNAIISKFLSFGMCCDNAFDSQALLQLKNEYCNNGKCMECTIGMELLKS